MLVATFPIAEHINIVEDSGANFRLGAIGALPGAFLLRSREERPDYCIVVPIGGDLTGFPNALHRPLQAVPRCPIPARYPRTQDPPSMTWLTESTLSSADYRASVFPSQHLRFISI